MSRRISALVGVGALTAMSALAATASADASTQRQHPSASAQRHPLSTHVQRASAKASGAIAVFGTDNGTFQVVRDVNGTRAKKSALLTTGGDAVAASINPVGGQDGVFCTEDNQIFTAKRLRTTPHLVGSTIDARHFKGEGADNYDMFCYSTAVHGSFALVTADSQGLVQLIRKQGDWRIDKRVQFPGHNDAGNPHRPGFIDIRDSTAEGTLFDGVAIAPSPLPNGKFLAVTSDRENSDPGDDALVVVSGVGTANPKVRGAVTSPSVLINDINLGSLDFGHAGMAFVPGSADKVLVLTRNGFAVLGLHDLAHPKLKHKVAIPAARDTDFDPVSLTISKDGDHLAVAVGPKVYVYKNVQAAIAHGKPFRKQGSFAISASPDDIISDVGFTSNNNLLVLHGSSATTDGWQLTVVKKVIGGHHAIKGSTNTVGPTEAGSLSVWPPA